MGLSTESIVSVINLYSFESGLDELPNDLIQGTDGNFYGTTTYGGVYSDGAIFKMTIN